MKRLLLLGGWLGFLMCAGVLGFEQLRQHWVRRELNPVLRGQRLATQMGCFGCHGPENGAGVPNPGAPTDKVPALRSGTLMMDVSGPDEIREYIAEGYPRHRQGGTAWQRAQAASLKMPAYGDLLDAGQLDDLTAYYLSVNDARPVPAEAQAGRKLVAGLGCWNCHGLEGSGGVQNPGSLKGSVPGWLGADYAELVADEGELREWILEGGLARLSANPAARHFLERQKLQMPPYRNLVDKEQLEQLVAYIRWLRTEPSLH